MNNVKKKNKYWWLYNNDN